TGMTSGTREVSPIGIPSTGTPQTDIPISGTVIPTQTTDSEWTVQANPATRRMIVQIVGDGPPTGKSGDCTLQLFHEEGGQLRATSTVADSGSQAQQETIIISNPATGRWVARVGDFALCTHYSGL